MDNEESSQSQNQEMLPMIIDDACYRAILAEIDEKYWKPKCLRMREKLRKSYQKTARILALYDIKESQLRELQSAAENLGNN